MFTFNNTPNRTVIIDNEEHLFFSGYSYLGIHQNTEFKKYLQDSFEQYGTFFPSSRISNTQLLIYEEVETFLNKQFLSISNLYHTALFSNGFLSGLAAQKIFNDVDKTFNAPHTHPAISNEVNTESRTEWSQNIISEIQKNNYQKILIKSDSVDVLNSEILDFEFLKNIPANCFAHVLIDDSHGIGLIGNNGNGIVDYLTSLQNIQYHFNYSLSKSYGIPGGAFSSSKEFITTIKNTTEFTATTPPIPAYLNCFLKSTDLYSEQREKLLQNIIFFKEKTINLSIVQQFPLPIFKINSSLIKDVLDKNKIIISSFSYPKENGDKYNRIVLNAHHSVADLDTLLSVLYKALS